MKTVPEPSKRRLVLLERLLSTYEGKTITSQKIQELTGWSSALVRKEIAYLKIKSGTTKGYKMQELKTDLKTLFVGSEKKHCCIVGLGRMGQMLFDTSELYDSPFKIVAGFDSSVNKTEVLSSSFPLHPTTLMRKVIAEEKISYAILTVEMDEAQVLTNLLVECGIKGIVNYTPCVLTVPKDVSVENVNLLTALENLSL